MAKDGVEGFEQFIAFLKSKYPDSHSEIKQAFVDGNNVILHVEVTGREPGVTRAIVDIFRLNEQHKIVEHWDVTQNVPPKTASGNGMFKNPGGILLLTLSLFPYSRPSLVGRFSKRKGEYLYSPSFMR